MEETLGFIIAALALAGSPGPANISLAATAAAFGGRRSLPYLFGIVSGMAVVVTVAAGGVTGALFAVSGLQPAFAIAAAAYFLYLAYRIATAPPLEETAGERRQPAFAAGLFLSLVNPKAYAAMTALFSGFALTGVDPAAGLAIKLAVIACVVVSVTALWLLAGAGLTRLFRDPKLNRLVNVIFAALLLASLPFALLF